MVCVGNDHIYPRGHSGTSTIYPLTPTVFRKYVVLYVTFFLFFSIIASCRRHFCFPQRQSFFFRFANDHIFIVTHRKSLYLNCQSSQRMAFPSVNFHPFTFRSFAIHSPATLNVSIYHWTERKAIQMYEKFGFYPVDCFLNVTMLY